MTPKEDQQPMTTREELAYFLAEYSITNRTE